MNKFISSASAVIFLVFSASSAQASSYKPMTCNLAFKAKGGGVQFIALGGVGTRPRRKGRPVHRDAGERHTVKLRAQKVRQCAGRRLLLSHAAGPHAAVHLCR